MLLSIGCASADKIKVVATFSILADMIQQVAGDKVVLTTLVGPNSDVHEYEPTPQDIVLLGRAQLVFENGLNLENWLDKMYDASGSTAQRIVVTTGVRVRSMPENAQEKDPHAWQDIGNGVIYVQNITQALVSLDPAHADVYQANAKRYIEALNGLDVWATEELKGIKNRTIVTNHDALGYFADHYQFNIVGAVIPSATTEASDPSAKQMAALFNVIKAHGVQAIFTENVTNTRLAETLAAQAQVKLVEGVYTDALGEPTSEAGTYAGMMRTNIKVFKQNLE